MSTLLMKARLLPLALALLPLTGCHALRENCNEPQPYELAKSVPALKLPEGLAPVNIKGALAIPEVPGERKKLTPRDACRDAPPAYYTEKATPAG